jgi:hypothetical protein
MALFVEYAEIDIIDHSNSNEACCSKIDPSGTDPNRYKNISPESVNGKKEDEDDDDYNKEPKNHTTTEERFIEPDRGE